MQFLRDLPLKRKLLFGLLATCMATLALACAALFWFQTVTFRNGFVAELESLAAIIAHNSAAPLAFGDRKSAAEVLAALRAKPQIAAAQIFDGDGAVFARYGEAIPALDDSAASAGEFVVVFQAGYAVLRLPIKLDEARPGRLVLTARFADEYRELFSLYASVLLAVLAGSLVVILLMSAALQRLIIRPVTALADVARNISAGNDYSVRARETSRDEVGLLTRTFNRMLDQIQSRETSLRESQQRYEVAVMGSSDGLWDYDFASNAVYYSPRCKEIVGYADHEFENRPGAMQELMHPADRAAFDAKIRSYFADGRETYETEFRLRHKDGSYRWILSRGAALRDDHGKPFRFAGSHTDITERKLADERERERAERAVQRQAVLLKLSRLEPLEWDRQLETVLAEVAQFLGLARASYWRLHPRQQVLAREKLFLLEGAAFETEPVRLRLAELPPHIAGLARAAQPVAFGTALRDPRFTASVPVSALHAPVGRNEQLAGVLVCEHVGDAREWNSGEIEFVRAVAQQIALALEGQERRRAEAQLRQSEVRYRTVVESVQEVIFQTDAKGRWVFLNSAWRDITGHFAEDSLGRSCIELIHPEDRPRAAQELRGLLSGRKKSNRGEFRFVTSTGEVRWIEVAAQIVLDRDSPLVGSSGTMVDITARKATEAEMARLHRELVDTSRQAGMAEVATGVLHNVGNVLNSVNVSANLIVEHVRKSKTASLAKAVKLLREREGDLGNFLAHDPKGRQLPPFLAAVSEQLTREHARLDQEVQALQANIEHIKQIVAMQQSYAKISGAHEKLPLADLVEDALRMSASSLAKHGIELVREFAAVAPVLVDRHKVLQILVNLIGNAKQAMDTRAEGRRLTLRIAPAGDERVRVEVSDNGMGIPAENLTRIFSHGFTTKKNGHGFGLHSGANAAKELGGSLTVRSDGAGCGATFCLELPGAAKAALASAA